MIDRYGIGSSRWRVPIPLSEFKGTGFSSRLFAYVQAGLGDRPLSREILQELTGVSKSTQIRGEKAKKVLVQQNFGRVDATSIEDAVAKMPVVREGCAGHRFFRSGASLYFQIPNSFSHADIRRRKRVVHGSCGHCGDNAALQPTNRERYFADCTRAVKKREWHVQIENQECRLPVFVVEEPMQWRGKTVGVWGVI